MPAKRQPTLAELGKKRAAAAEAVVVDVDGPAAKKGARTETAVKKATAAATTATKKAVSPAAAAPVVSAADAKKAAASFPATLSELVTEPQWKAATSTLLGSGSAPATRIVNFLRSELSAGRRIFPPVDHIFAALNETPLDAVRVVLIGQDPYHDDNQAHGLCFSVLPGVKTPPSLVNMYKELTTDIKGFVTPPHGYLLPWAQRGMLMLNATLTVEPHKPNSHAPCGWQNITDALIQAVSKYHQDKGRGIVFLLWGGFAQKKAKLINASVHRVISVAHPSPLSATKWWGCKTFSKCNAALKELGHEPFDWSLPTNPNAAA